MATVHLKCSSGVEYLEFKYKTASGYELTGYTYSEIAVDAYSSFTITHVEPTSSIWTSPYTLYYNLTETGYTTNHSDTFTSTRSITSLSVERWLMVACTYNPPTTYSATVTCGDGISSLIAYSTADTTARTIYDSYTFSGISSGGYVYISSVNYETNYSYPVTGSPSVTGGTWTLIDDDGNWQDHKVNISSASRSVTISAEKNQYGVTIKRGEGVSSITAYSSYSSTPVTISGSVTSYTFNHLAADGYVYFSAISYEDDYIYPVYGNAGGSDWTIVNSDGDWSDRYVYSYGTDRTATVRATEKATVYNYKLTVNYNGATTTPGGSTIKSNTVYGPYSSVETYYTFTLPTSVGYKTGYACIGFSYDSSATTAQFSIGGELTLYSGVPQRTVYAVWLPGYTIDYDPNGGSSTPSSKQYIAGTIFSLASSISRNDSSTSTAQIVSFDSQGGGSVSGISYLKTITTKYAFSKWEDDYTGTQYSAGATFTMPSRDVTMVAQWAEAYVTSRSSITLPSCSWSGYRFTGWYTSGGVYVGGAGTSYTPPYDNPTLYAHWAALYTLRYDTNGGTPSRGPQYGIAGESLTVLGAVSKSSSSVETSLTFTFDSTGGSESSYTRSSTKIVRTDYTFYKWYDEYGGTYFSPGDSYTMPASNVTMSARYTEDVVTARSSITLPTPVRPYYTFSGWFTAKTGGTFIGMGDVSWMPDRDSCTLYAHWGENFTQGIFYWNNGSSYYSTSDTSTSANHVFENPSNPPDYETTEYKYKFQGWGDDTTTVNPAYATSVTVGTTNYTASVSNPDNRIYIKYVYAVWKKIEIIKPFAWTSDDDTYIATGQLIEWLTASKWNGDLTEKIHKVEERMGYTPSTLPTVVRGERVTAAKFNAMKNAIANLPSAGTLVDDRVAGEAIKACYFNGVDSDGKRSIKNGLNASITYVNSL